MLTITPPTASAIFPVAPAAESIPAPSRDPQIEAILATLAALHYAAFETLYGPAPAGVSVHAVKTGQVDGPMLPTYMAQASADAGPAAIEWLEAFRAGLDRWAEVEMANPVTFVPVAGDDTGERVQATVAEYDAIIVGACRRLKQRGRVDLLRNLVIHTQGRLPDRYNPDHPSYGAAG